MYFDINWQQSNQKYTGYIIEGSNLFLIPTKGDGNSLFHSLVAMNKINMADASYPICYPLFPSIDIHNQQNVFKHVVYYLNL